VDLAAVRKGDPSADAQTEAGPADGPGRVGLVETLEDVGEVLGGNTHARVDHLHARPILGRFEPDGHGPARLGELDRIVDQVRQQLPELGWEIE
jgi:hypothetical protein